MKKISNKLRVVILGLILFTISATLVVTNGNKYTVEINNLPNIHSLNEISVNLDSHGENTVAVITGKSLENNVLKIDIESKSKGMAYLTVSCVENSYLRYYTIYVHNSSIITFDNYFGDCTMGISFAISTVIITAYILFLLIKTYLKNSKINLYQYKNISYLGFIIFLSFAFICQLVFLINYRSFIYSIKEFMYISSNFSLLLLPIAFVVAVFVVFSNIILIKNEGRNIHNLLGLILGSLICFATIVPEMLYHIFDITATDIHNEQTLSTYLYLAFENTVYCLVSYLECILISTIIIGIKSAKHIPAFDKDFILILGCQIKKDGSLTNLLKSRADRAIEFYEMQKKATGKELMFVPSGGKGDDEIISEAQAIKNYLVCAGIREDSILIEDKSKNTEQNIAYSHMLIKEIKADAKTAFSTTNYHVLRAGALAQRQGINMEGIGAKTKAYFWINAFIREFIATLFSDKKKHIAVICAIIIGVAVMVFLVYLSNVII